MEESASRMNGLISDLLRYATVGRQEITLGLVSLDETVQRVISALESEIAERNAKISIPETLPVVRGDRTLLFVVFQTLLANALKFVAAGTVPEIEIIAVTDANIVTVFVTDFGVGILFFF